MATPEELLSKEDEMFAATMPAGRWTERGLNMLVKATNKVLPLFGQTGDYPTFPVGEVRNLPGDFVRVLTMIADAVKDAVNAEVLDAGAGIVLEGMMDDSGAILLASKLDKLSKDRQFKSFLKEPKPEMEMPESTTPEKEEVDEDELFAMRMR